MPALLEALAFYYAGAVLVCAYCVRRRIRSGSYSEAAKFLPSDGWWYRWEPLVDALILIVSPIAVVVIVAVLVASLPLRLLSLVVGHGGRLRRKEA